MEETTSRPDIAPLLDAAADFASCPGLQNDASVKQFLDQFPLPVMFGALQNAADIMGLEDKIVACLDRIFKTKYGASLLTQYVPFLQAGLQAHTEIVRCLACRAVSNLLENTEDRGSAVQMIVEHHIYPLLINCLLDGNEQTSAASLDAIRIIAESPEGIMVIFPSSSLDSIQLKNVAENCSSLARIRILALIAKLFSLSISVASEVYNSGLLSLFETEINNKSDMLTSLSALELLYELVESPHSASFVSKTSLLQLLTELISNSSSDSVLRTRAVLISGRLLSSSDALTIIDERRLYPWVHYWPGFTWNAECFSTLYTNGYAGQNLSTSVVCNGIRSLLSAIDGRLNMLDSHDTDECESALESLGYIGSSYQGATLLLTFSPAVARHVVDSAFNHQGRGRQLAALHALGDICGADRPEYSKLLPDKAEECLKHFVYVTAANSSKLTPSGLLLSVLQQEPETRIAAYRLISGIVARPWCLVEVCSRQEILATVTDPDIESTKRGMEARHQCCVAINQALSGSNVLKDVNMTEIAGKLEEAVRRGPYLAKKKIEAQPLVVTAERF